MLIKMQKVSVAGCLGYDVLEATLVEDQKNRAFQLLVVQVMMCWAYVARYVVKKIKFQLLVVQVMMCWNTEHTRH